METTFALSKTKRLLIVDDERSVREVLAEGLSAMSYDTEIAGSAQEALDLIREHKFHLILSDIEMPGVTGIDLLNKIKQLDEDLDVVMVTGLIDAQTAIQAMRQMTGPQDT